MAWFCQPRQLERSLATVDMWPLLLDGSAPLLSPDGIPILFRWYARLVFDGMPGGVRLPVDILHMWTRAVGEVQG